MFYIGISAYYHESSVFLTDGININCFLKEEYFTRIKGDKSFPKRSLEFLIKKYSLNEKNIKSVCFYEKPFKKTLRQLKSGQGWKWKENNIKKFYGIQFHPEVTHTKNGKKLIKNFVFNICKSNKGSCCWSW